MVIQAAPDMTLDFVWLLALEGVRILEGSLIVKERFVQGELKAPRAPEVVYLNPKTKREQEGCEQEREADTGEEKPSTQPAASFSSPGGAPNARAVSR